MPALALELGALAAVVELGATAAACGYFTIGPNGISPLGSRVAALMVPLHVALIENVLGVLRCVADHAKETRRGGLLPFAVAFGVAFAVASIRPSSKP